MRPSGDNATHDARTGGVRLGRGRAAVAAFAGGATVMAVELLASRWLAPAYGFTLGTWTALIAVTLSAGAVGAWTGGEFCRATAPARVVGGCFFFAGVWIAGCGWGAPALAEVLADTAGGLWMATISTIGPPVIAAAAVYPVLVQHAHDGAAPRPETPCPEAPRGVVGRIAGRLAAFSTAGSLVGTLTTGLWSIPGLGVRNTAFVLGAAMMLLAGAVAFGRRGVAITAVAAAISTAGIACREHAGSNVDVVETPYGRLELVTAPDWVELSVNGIPQARYAPSMIGEHTLLANRNPFGLLPYLRPGRWRALQIGLGAGVLSRCLGHHGFVFDHIEVNESLVRLLRRRIGPIDHVVIGDGRRIMRRHAKDYAGRYDFILLDVFHGESPPAHLFTRESFERCAACLSADGILAVHLIGTPDAAVTQSVALTLRAVFPHSLAVRGGTGPGLQDIVLFASQALLAMPRHAALERNGWLGHEAFDVAEDAAEFLTDDRNPLERLNAPLAAALRAAHRTSKSKPPASAYE